MSKGKGEPEGRITGRTIIDQLVRNMELGQFEMAYSVLLPCIFSLYLHPEDYTRLHGVLDLIREDAKRALASRLEQWNAKPLGLGVIRGGKQRKPYKIAVHWQSVFLQVPQVEPVSLKSALSRALLSPNF